MAHLTRGAVAVMIPLIAITLVGCSDDMSNVFVPNDPVPDDPVPGNAGPAAVMPEAVGQVYNRVGSSEDEPPSERYDIAEDGTFRLQFLSPRWGFFEYLGTYSREGSKIGLAFEDSNTAGEWRASGTLDGDCLTVEYNSVMLLADFENGEYCRPLGT